MYSYVKKVLKIKYYNNSFFIIHYIHYLEHAVHLIEVFGGHLELAIQVLELLRTGLLLGRRRPPPLVAVEVELRVVPLHHARFEFRHGLVGKVAEPVQGTLDANSSRGWADLSQLVGWDVRRSGHREVGVRCFDC